jgi:AraC-like DNA-binding protein
LEPDRTVFASPLVSVGVFRCPVDHPKFIDSGPTGTYCFVFPRTSLWIQHEGAAAFVADPTVVTMYNPEQRYRRRSLSAEGDRSDWFAVTPSLLREVLTAYDTRSADHADCLFCFSRGPSDPDTYRLQRMVLRYIRSASEIDTLFVEEAVVTLLSRTLATAYALRGVRRRDAAARHSLLVERARAFLNEHYTESASLGDIARAAGCSEFHLCRVFRELTGLTLHAYRHQLRLRRSLEPICEGTRDLIDIALALGYASHSHFTAAFRRTFGVTPSALR